MRKRVKREGSRGGSSHSRMIKKERRECGWERVWVVHRCGGEENRDATVSGLETTA